VGDVSWWTVARGVVEVLKSRRGSRWSEGGPVGLMKVSARIGRVMMMCLELVSVQESIALLQ
jgi:hypothetical protein